MQSLRLMGGGREAKHKKVKLVDPQLQELTSFTQQLQTELHQSRLQVHHLNNDKQDLEQQLDAVYADCRTLRDTLATALARVREVEREAKQAHRLRAKVCALEARVSQLRGENSHQTCRCGLRKNQVLSASLDSHLADKKWTVFEFDSIDVNKPQETQPAQDDRAKKCLSADLAGVLLAPMLSVAPQRSEPALTLVLPPSPTPGLPPAPAPYCSPADLLAKLQVEVTALTQERTDLRQEKEKVERQLRLKELECQEKDGELQSIETERVRLSLLEDKTGDVIEILKGMRRKKVASYIIGTYLTDIIDEMAVIETWEETAVEMFVRLLHQKLCKSTLLPCLAYHEFQC